MPTPNLTLFTAPWVTRPIGLTLFAEFFARLTHLLPSKYSLPAPCPGNDCFFDSLAQTLQQPGDLPGPLLLTLRDVEATAAAFHQPDGLPEDHPDRNPENTESARLRQAIVLWLRQNPPPNGQPKASKPADDSTTAGLPDNPPTPVAPEPATCNPQPATHGKEPATHNKPRPTLPPDWVMKVDPCPNPVNGKLLLDALRALLARFVVLPKWAAETLALWILHTYAFELRDVATYLGVESPVRRCGKTTLLTILSRLVSRPVVAANVSSPALFRAIEELRPTLLIDEADTFLKANDELQGILNAGYHRPTAYVVRVGQQSPAPDSKSQTPSLAFFSSWCPKVISRIGRIPDTLADRCIVIRMQRKTSKEQCERLRLLEATPLRQQCARFVLDHAQAITAARPEIPSALNDRAADIWEPLLALADLAGGDWPDLARQAALGLSAGAPENNPVGSLLLDIFILFCTTAQDRMFTRDLLDALNTKFTDRPWMESRNGRQITEMWLASQLRPFGIIPRTLRADDSIAKGYLREDFTETFRRYIPKSELEAILADPIKNPPAP